MNDILSDSAFFGFALTLFCYWIGIEVSKRLKIMIFNPLMIGLILIIVILLVCHIEVSTYNYGARYLLHFLTPATVCLAVPLYRKLQVLKDNLFAVLVGVLSGCLTSAASILFFAKLSGFDATLFYSLLPKSITTAMAIGVSEEMGGIAAITVIGVILAGFTGAVIASWLFRILKIEEPVAQGLAIGTGSHALGTSRALQIGEVQGAMSGLAIVVSGVITVVLAPIAAGFW